MLKKPSQSGRSERESEAYGSRYVEGLSDARTQPGERRVHGLTIEQQSVGGRVKTEPPGWAGENIRFCSIRVLL